MKKRKPPRAGRSIAARVLARIKAARHHDVADGTFAWLTVLMLDPANKDAIAHLSEIYGTGQSRKQLASELGSVHGEEPPQVFHKLASPLRAPVAAPTSPPAAHPAGREDADAFLAHLTAMEKRASEAHAPSAHSVHPTVKPSEPEGIYTSISPASPRTQGEAIAPEPPRAEPDSEPEREPVHQLEPVELVGRVLADPRHDFYSAKAIAMNSGLDISVVQSVIEDNPSLVRTAMFSPLYGQELYALATRPKNWREYLSDFMFLLARRTRPGI